MSAEDIAGLFCDDISFCPATCGRISCPRNRINIRDRTIPHSYFADIPDDCPEKKEEQTPEWIEFDSHPSSTTFICPHCREKVYFSHGSSHKARKHGIAKRCLYKFCPWCGQPVAPLRVNYISDEP